MPVRFSQHRIILSSRSPQPRAKVTATGKQALDFQPSTKWTYFYSQTWHFGSWVHSLDVSVNIIGSVDWWDNLFTLGQFDSQHSLLHFIWSSFWQRNGDLWYRRDTFKGISVLTLPTASTNICAMTVKVGYSQITDNKRLIQFKLENLATKFQVLVLRLLLPRTCSCGVWFERLFNQVPFKGKKVGVLVKLLWTDIELFDNTPINCDLIMHRCRISNLKEPV